MTAQTSIRRERTFGEHQKLLDRWIIPAGRSSSLSSSRFQSLRGKPPRLRPSGRAGVLQRKPIKSAPSTRKSGPKCRPFQQTTSQHQRASMKARDQLYLLRRCRRCERPSRTGRSPSYGMSLKMEEHWKDEKKKEYIKCGNRSGAPRTQRQGLRCTQEDKLGQGQACVFGVALVIEFRLSQNGRSGRIHSSHTTA